MRAPLLSAALTAVLIAGAGCPGKSVPVQPDPGPRAEVDAPPPPIVVPRRDGPQVIVLPAQVIRAPLFAPELSRLERWVARHLATQGALVLDAVPPEEVETLRRRLEQGRIAEAGPRCLAAMPVRASLEQAWPKAHRALVTADCSASPCELRVEVVTPNGAPAAAFRSPVSGTATFRDWEAAAQALVAAEPMARTVNQAPVAVVETEPEESERVALTHLGAHGKWTWKPTPAEFEEALPQVRQCHETGHLPTGPTWVVLEYGADGRARTCAGQSWRDPPLAEQLGCYCTALGGPTLGEGAPGRRLVLELVDAPDVGFSMPTGQRISAWLEDFRSSDPAIREHWVVSALPWVAMCYGTTRLTDEVAFPVEFTLDARGQVVSSRIGGLERSEVLGACVAGYLQNVVLPCPFSGTAQLKFTVRVRRSVSSPRPSTDPRANR
jgi:hypothetical protein